MFLSFGYYGSSTIVRSDAGLAVSLAPNLRRDRVSYVGMLQRPLHFREAMSALHDVVISDLRYQPKDRTAYRQYLAEQQKRESSIRRAAAAATRELLKKDVGQPMPPGLEKRYRDLRGLYWNARQQYSNYLYQHDPELWRLLMPCDPVITVAPDVLFFECFSADESSYGCLSVDRGAFQKETDVALGTTNIDYSWKLYEHFQNLRNYRETRFAIDPAGFEVKTQEAAQYREEKIELPPSWLRGFMQLQSAMSLPMRRVPVSREGLYNLLFWLKRHRAKKSPRAIRFELDPGQAVQVVLEPWERRIVFHDTVYPGSPRRVDPRVGPRSPGRAGSPAADPGPRRRLPARYRLAELLGRMHGRDAPDAGAVGLDRERLDRRERARSARGAGGAEPGRARRHRGHVQDEAGADVRIVQRSTRVKKRYAATHPLERKFPPPRYPQRRARLLYGSPYVPFFIFVARNV